MPNALSPELIAELLKLDQKKEVRAGINLICGGCNTRLDNGYCRNVDCTIDAPIPTYECKVCGNCPNPLRCVASIECPRCSIGVGNLCKDDRGGLTGYHEERWQGVKMLHGVYYKS